MDEEAGRARSAVLGALGCRREDMADRTIGLAHAEAWAKQHCERLPEADRNVLRRALRAGDEALSAATARLDAIAV